MLCSRDKNIYCFEQITSQSIAVILETCNKIYNKSNNSGISPTLNMMDNEASKTVCKLLTKEKTDRQSYHCTIIASIWNSVQLKQKNTISSLVYASLIRIYQWLVKISFTTILIDAQHALIISS